MSAKQVQMDSCSQARGLETQPAKTSASWRSSTIWSFACVGGGSLLIAAFLAWGRWEFGSLSSTLAYLNGERLLVDPGMLSFGAARRGEERDLHVTIRNRTGKAVRLLGARSTCGCMAIMEQFPLSIADRGQQEVAIRIWPAGKDSLFEGRIDFYYADEESNSAATNEKSSSVATVTVRGTIAD